MNNSVVSILRFQTCCNRAQGKRSPFRLPTVVVSWFRPVSLVARAPKWQNDRRVARLMVLLIRSIIQYLLSIIYIRLLLNNYTSFRRKICCRQLFPCSFCSSVMPSSRKEPSQSPHLLVATHVPFQNLQWRFPHRDPRDIHYLF